MKFGHALALATKDWKRIFREPAFLFMIILFPVMLTVAFGTSFGAVGGSQTTFNLGMVALGGNSTSSTQFYHDMQATGALKMTSYSDNGTAQSALSQGKLQAVVLLPASFDETVQSFRAHPTEPSMWTNSTLSIYLDRGSALTAQVIPTIVSQALDQGLLGVEPTDQALPISISAPSQVTVKGSTVFQSFAPGLFAFASIYMIMVVANPSRVTGRTGFSGGFW